MPACRTPAAGQKPGLWAASLFLIALFLFFKSQQFVTITATAEIEAIIHKLRVRLMDMIRHSELLELERIGRSRIVAAVTSDTAVLTQASNMLCFTVQGAVLIFFVGLYVAYLSLTAFALTVVIVTGAGFIFHHKNKRLAAQKGESAAWERRLFDRLVDFLDGFKEVRLNAARSEDLVRRRAGGFEDRGQHQDPHPGRNLQDDRDVADFDVHPARRRRLRGAQSERHARRLIDRQDHDRAAVHRRRLLSAWCRRSRSCSMPMRRPIVSSVLRRLCTPPSSTTSRVAVAAPKRFERIEMRNITFRYVDKFSDTVFKIGPIDFSLRAGELVFITGGNGSGKSTFLRVLAGLYPPDSGEVLVDGRPITNATRDEYRGLMSAIFFDYHLFQRLYGLPDATPGDIESLLAQFRLSDKTALSNGEFRTLDLSGGQRRRLALIVSMLEKRPIMILDEWTAEQDPEFRRKFYDELLPDMLQAGATIVVITHDDRYLDELHLPARRIRMDEGRIVEERTMG